MAQTDMNTSVHVPEELLETATSLHFEGAVLLEELACGPDAYRFDEPVAWSVDVTNTGGALLVMGRAEARATAPCARCLADAVYDVEGDEFDYLPEDRVIDMVPLIVSALLLELPLVPLCDDDCKGLCPRCGANLNEGPCACDAEAAADAEESPFAALKDFKFE